MTTAATRLTIKDKLEENARWRARVEESTADYATEAWKARAFTKIDRLDALLNKHPLDMPIPRIHEAITSPLFTAEQQWVIRWQFAKHLGTGDYFTALFKAIEHADGENLNRLELAYPDLIGGVKKYRSITGWSDFIDLLERT